MTRRLLVVVALLLPVLARAQLHFPQLRTTLVRLEGTWGPPRPGHSAAADLELEHGDDEDRMQVETARILMGDRSGPDVLAEASARRPAFRVRGPRQLLARLDAAEPGQHVEITGYIRSGSTELQASSVIVGDQGR